MTEQDDQGAGVLDDEGSTLSKAGTPTGVRGVSGKIGPYRLVREIGQGGMGIVFEAEQEVPVRRKVALKLVKWGMDTREVMARFESERQALALMNHPNIASVYEAGATEQGRPYFAMEFVQGIPITEYCDKNRLTVPERLRLFIDVCEGIQHAHQKGIIHRDIKPSNVLVSVQNDQPSPKIIDFGVAKATAQRLTESSVYTELGQLIGTPEYMSPEQAEMTNLDIDTRTDVYSLGVLLYELLAGMQPFDSKELRKAGLLEIQRKLREDEPARPSARISGVGAASTLSASNRRVDLRGLQRALGGDLDWITMKALEKDRIRRYETAHALALDVQRHLNDEPVSQARLATTLAKLGRYAEAERLAAQAAAVGKENLGEEHPEAVAAHLARASALRGLRRADEAGSILRRQLAVLDGQKALGKVVGDHDALTSEVRVQLGMALADGGRRPEAEALLAESVPRLPARHADSKRALQFMVRFYEDWERSAPNQGHGARAALWRGRL